MEDKSRALRWTILTAIAPIAWGSTYYITREYLPADYPLWGSVIRALPAGILLLIVRPRLPRGAWWWRSVVLGTLNVGAFLVLVYIAAQVLPTSLASTIMATSPVVMMVFAWALLAQRPALLSVIGAVLGIAGVALMLATSNGHVEPVGVFASIGALTMSSLGGILATRWSARTPGGIDLLATTSWQLVAGGIMLVPVAAAVEGAPPQLDGAAILSFVYVIVIATALAYAVWFGGFRHLPAGTVGLIGLLNPVTGVLLGTLLAREVLTAQQLVGLGIVAVGILLGQPIVRGLVARRRTTVGRTPTGRGRRDPSDPPAPSRAATPPAAP